MMGCTGGAVSGTMTSTGLQFTVGEFKKPLVTGDRPVYPGGTVSLLAALANPASAPARLSCGAWRGEDDGLR